MVTVPTLHPYQEATKDFMTTRTKCAAFLPMGMGKTLVTLSALNEIRPAGNILVIAPLNIVRSTWIDEIEKWGFPVACKSLVVNERGNKLSRKKRLELYAQIPSGPPTMYFINHDLIHDLVENMPQVNQGGRKVTQWPFSTIIIDESQSMKNGQSRRFKALKRVAPATTRIIEMTGTPTPGGLLDLWAQIYLLDEGQALGRTFTAYREKYFKPTRYVNGRPVQWEPLPGAEDEIYQRISHLVMSIENTQLQLPELTINDVTVHMDAKETKLYEQMKSDFIVTLPTNQAGQVDVVEAVNTGVLSSKLLQIASGTLYTDDAHNYQVVHDRKIEMCDYIINNTAGPVLIAYKFVSDRKELLSKLTKAGHDVRVFDGSRAMIHAWNRREIPVMLLQPASAGHGLNLQDGGSDLIWYTLPWSLEHYAQTNARLHRQGQTEPVVIHRLITAGTFDARLPGVLSNKDAVQAELLEAVRMEVSSIMGNGGVSLPPGPMQIDWDAIEDYGTDLSDRF